MLDMLEIGFVARTKQETQSFCVSCLDSYLESIQEQPGTVVTYPGTLRVSSRGKNQGLRAR